MHPDTGRTTKVVSNMAASAAKDSPLKKNIIGERNGANLERSTEPASAVMGSAGRGGVVKLSRCMVFGGLRRGDRSPSPPNGQIADDISGPSGS
jgi:hypothetical protein